jgi:hypothetical protein
LLAGVFEDGGENRQTRSWAAATAPRRIHRCSHQSVCLLLEVDHYWVAIDGDLFHWALNSTDLNGLRRVAARIS